MQLTAFHFPPVFWKIKVVGEIYILYILNFLELVIKINKQNKEVTKQKLKKNTARTDMMSVTLFDVLFNFSIWVQT